LDVPGLGYAIGDERYLVDVLQPIIDPRDERKLGKRTWPISPRLREINQQFRFPGKCWLIRGETRRPPRQSLYLGGLVYPILKILPDFEKQLPPFVVEVVDRMSDEN
jgi:hypothetical protein